MGNKHVLHAAVREKERIGFLPAWPIFIFQIYWLYEWDFAYLFSFSCSVDLICSKKGLVTKILMSNCEEIFNVLFQSEKEEYFWN